MNKVTKTLLNTACVTALMTSMSYGADQVASSQVAPGAPGQEPTWAYAGKSAIGTSYEQYVGGRYSDEAKTGKVSKVWFSTAQGILTETMFGLIHEAIIYPTKAILY